MFMSGESGKMVMLIGQPESHRGHIPKTCGSTSHCAQDHNWTAANREHGILYWKRTFQFSYGQNISSDPEGVIYL